MVLNIRLFVALPIACYAIMRCQAAPRGPVTSRVRNLRARYDHPTDAIYVQWSYPEELRQREGWSCLMSQLFVLLSINKADNDDNRTEVFVHVIFISNCLSACRTSAILGSLSDHQSSRWNSRIRLEICSSLRGIRSETWFKWSTKWRWVAGAGSFCCQLIKWTLGFIVCTRYHHDARTLSVKPSILTRLTRLLSTFYLYMYVSNDNNI